MLIALCIKLYQEKQCHEWRFNRIMKCYLCLVLHISLELLGVGVKFVVEGIVVVFVLFCFFVGFFCCCFFRNGEGYSLILPPVRFVFQRLMLNFHRSTVFSCVYIFNHDWLFLLSTILCPAQIPQSVYCIPFQLEYIVYRSLPRITAISKRKVQLTAYGWKTIPGKVA